jgi:DNA repair photolyase
MMALNMTSDSTTSSLRWRLESDAPDALFPTEALVERHVGTGEYRGLEFYEVAAKRVINEVPAASRMPFRYTINAYRGCSHACNFCFARPTHEYLGLNTGEDFDRKIVVKVNAVERVRSEVASPKWSGAHIAMGTNTDPYQKAEGKYHLTRGIVGVLAEARNPFSILTKSTLVLRDLDVLTAAAARTEVRLNFSIGTLDREVWRLTEPGTPPPDKRVEAVRRLNDVGIPCGVLIAPILPGLSDAPEQVRAVVDACVAAGAESISAIPLHLRPGVREHYLTWLRANRPDLLPLYEQRFTGRTGPRAYQPKAVAEALSAQVLGMVRDAERRAGGGRRAHVVDAGDGDRRRILAEQGIADQTPLPAAPPVRAEQLGLDL